MTERKQIKLAALTIIVIGSILRFWGLSDWSLTNDELSALNRVNFDSFTELIKEGIWVDGHPAFVQIFLFYWVKLFGNSVFSIRFPFILCGIGSLIYFYQICKGWFNSKIALICLSVFTCSQLFILYSQIARPYSMGLFFLLAFVYHFFQSINNKSVRTNSLLAIIFGLLCSLSHYFSALQVFLVFLFTLFGLKKNNFKIYLAIGVSMVLLYLPHLPITLNHLSIGGVGWLPKPESDFLLNFLEFISNGSLLLLVIWALVVIYLAIRKHIKLPNGKSIFFLGLFFIPFLIGYYYSIYRVPVIQFSVLIFSAPFLIIALFSIIKTNIKPINSIIISFLFLCFGMYTLQAERKFYTKKPFANFKAVAEKSVELNNSIGKENVLTIANINNKSYLDYYTLRKDSTFQYDIIDFKNSANLIEARKLISEGTQKYILVAFANNPVPSELHELIKEQYPKIYIQNRFFNSEVIVYEKSTNQRNTVFNTTFEEFPSDEKWNVNESKIQDSSYFSKPTAYYIDEETEYALTYKSLASNIFPDNNKWLTISAMLKGRKNSNLTVACSISRNDSTIFWRGAETTNYMNDTTWQRMTFVVAAPDDIMNSDLVTIYFWNNNKERIFVDDFKLTNFADSDYNYYEF